jgi:aminoglycoside/choline kinase family phosphotransferase
MRPVAHSAGLPTVNLNPTLLLDVSADCLVTSPLAVSWTDTDRHAAFEAWLTETAPIYRLDPASLRLASADASFRRYLRIDQNADLCWPSPAQSFIVMDAPPSHEDCKPFVSVAALLAAGGVHAPEVLAWNEAQGFMLLSDLGSRTYLSVLQALDLASPTGFKLADTLYRDALGALVTLQGIQAEGQVPVYDRVLLRRELDLFPEWYVQRHCGVTLTETQSKQLEKTFELILKTCEDQPMVLVHRDYHSRNLMLGTRPGAETAQGAGHGTNPGVLDFQDAVWGPVTYDVVSLLRDAYIEWDEPQQIDWAARYWQQAKKAGVPVQDDFGLFWRDLEWMGLHRHLKVLGIFARLNHRDGKSAYLKDLPLVWRHAHHVAMRYSVLTPLARLLEQLAGVKAEDGYTF